MNALSRYFACAVLLLCCGALGFAQTRLDIMLEGPWILYTYHDNSFENGNTVLIAITPGGVVDDDAGAGPKYFHSISVRTGDGYYIVLPGIYCLTFDSHCSRAGITTLDPDGYPAAATPVNVQAPPSWAWMSLYRSPTFATALILPMPDSYSTDGAWPMHFAPVFDINQNGYADSGTPKHSIAIQLHYSAGASTFGLLNCNNLPSCQNATDVAHTMLQNTGTLRIVMKSPENDDVCDPHVRHAYPMMIGLLGKDKNKAIKVIDPARGIDDNGNAVYTDNAANNCLQNEDQNPHSTSGAASPSHRPFTFNADNTFSVQIGGILKSINEIGENASAAQKKRLLLPNISDDIKRTAAKLDNQFPRISQMARIDDLLKLSRAKIRLVEAQFSAKIHSNGLASRGKVADQKKGPEAVESNFLNLLDNTNIQIKKFLDSSPTKSGNDCRAPILLAQ
jgi:hypothetical protein